MKPGDESFNSIFHLIGDLVFTTDLEGRVVDYNAWGERILGYSREDVLGHPLTDFWVNADECRKTFSWVISEGSVFVSNLEVMFKKKNGENVDLSLTLSKYKNGTGTLQGMIGVGRDVTEKKKVETELRNIHQELESFIYTISHDLKAPVLSIEGYTSLLIRNYQESLDDKGRRYLERIQSNIQKMGLLLKGLLELSRSGRVIGALSEASIGELLSSILKDMEAQLRQRGIQVVAADAFPKVICDRYRIAEVFENLLSNAMKFMGNQAHPKIEIGANENSKDYEFYVRDNGIGIDPVYHEKIFGIFQRLEEVPVEGSGVGLTIVKRIIESHGGRVWVSSEAQKGATFFFTLPKKPKEGDKHGQPFS